MLLDMVMLGSGMRESFRGFIEQQGFQLRLTPRGTMPVRHRGHGRRGRRARRRTQG
jgi:hypothetical protein